MITPRDANRFPKSWGVSKTVLTVRARPSAWGLTLHLPAVQAVYRVGSDQDHSYQFLGALPPHGNWRAWLITTHMPPSKNLFQMADTFPEIRWVCSVRVRRIGKGKAADIYIPKVALEQEGMAWCLPLEDRRLRGWLRVAAPRGVVLVGSRPVRRSN